MKLLILASFLISVLATPTLNYPFNNQLPPVAEWGKSYTYTFSSDTFKSSDGSEIKYSSSDIPSWLSLSDRTLSGTPQGGSGDQTVKFTIKASDASGSSQEDCVLQIAGDNLPNYSQDDLTKVLKNSGAIANDNSYVLVPGQPFDITFPSNFFSSDGRSVVGHYAVQADHSPLPIWLNFDGGAGKFSGLAPSVNSEIAQAQHFSIIYMVSTYNGFESAGATFNLLLGANVLSMNISKDSVNATVDKPFTYGAPMSQVTLNKEPLTTANLSSAKASIPGEYQSWLRWDDTNFTLTGTPPNSAAGSNITVPIEIVDKYNDAVSWDVDIYVSNQTSSTVFSTSSLPAANATRGQWFEYDLGNYVMTRDIALSISDSAPWLTVHSSNLSINGMVPRNFQSAMVNITATLNNSDKSKRASSGDGESLTAHLELYGTGPMASSSASASSSISRTTSMSHSHSSRVQSISATGSSASASATSSSTDVPSSSQTSAAVAPVNKKSGTNKVAIGCGVGIPVGLAALAALVLLLFCCRRRRQRKAAAGAAKYDEDSGDEKSRGNHLDATQISAPRPSSKGMEMAPVFRVESSGSESYEDALEYPGELGDDGTVLGTPDKKGTDREGWNTPQRASTLNFLAMDGDSSHDATPVRGPAGADDNITLASVNPSNPRRSDDLGIPPHREEDDVIGDIPRESWRHTNTGDRRWQDARISHSSLASIVPTEPPTVQLASEEFQPYQPQPPQPRQMSREYSSGVLHRVGSHSSSYYTESIRNSADIPNRISGHYGTESSAGSRNSQELSDSSSGDTNFRPYRDENGELHWRQEVTGAGSARLNNVGLDRKPSAAKTPRGDQGEFVFV